MKTANTKRGDESENWVLTSREVTSYWKRMKGSLPRRRSWEFVTLSCLVKERLHGRLKWKGNVSKFFFSRSWEFVLQTVSYQISSCSWQDGTETSTDLYVFKNVKNLYILYILVRDGPLEKLWGGGGEFLSCSNFFHYQIPCMNFF